MAVRSKMSTARSRGRAVVKTTTEDKNALPKEKPKTYSNQYRASTKEGVDYSIADVTPEDEARIRKQYGISDKEDFVITKADYDVYKNTGKKSLEEYGADRAKGNNPFQKNYEGEVGGMQLQMYEKGKAPKAKPDPQNIREAAKKVPKLDKFAVFTDDKKKSYDVTTKEKKAKEDIMVPETVSGPKSRTVTRKTITATPKRSGAKMYKKQTAGKGYSAGKLFQTATVEKTKGPRLSEKIKYKKEEKLAGARERVLGLSGVALEDQTNKSGTTIKRGQKLEGSAQRLKDLKALYSSDSIKGEKVNASTETGLIGSKSRVGLLKGAKADVKEISKLSKGQVKSIKEAKKSAKTKEEKASLKSSIRNTRDVAKEARSYKGDIRKGLRMEKKDITASKVAAKASDAKTARKTEKGKTMRGTSYFSMTELNKKIPLSKAYGVSKDKEPKMRQTRQEKKEMANKNVSEKLGQLMSKAQEVKKRIGSSGESKGYKQAGTRRFISK